MAIQCPICNNNRTILTESRLNLYRCNSCFHAFTLISKEKQETYSEDYFLKKHKNWFSNPDRRLFDFIYAKLLKFLEKRQIRLLDVGCGKGTFLRYVAKKNPAAKLFGIDLVDNQCPGIHFIKGDFLEEKIEGKFNVICSLVTIEHVNAPHLFVKTINDLLEAGGLVFIMTINSNGLIYRLARLLNKVGIHIVYDRLYSSHHLNHYTNQSLRKLMQLNGFDVLLQKNHNYSMRAVDVPEGNFLIEKICKFSVWLVFLISSIFKCEYLQTIVCRKGE